MCVCRSSWNDLRSLPGLSRSAARSDRSLAIRVVFGPVKPQTHRPKDLRLGSILLAQICRWSDEKASGSRYPNGWILEKYLSPSNGPSSTPAALELTDTVPAIAAPQKSKKWGQSPKRSKSATRVSKHRSAVARWDPYRWGWRADRRRDFRVFMLGPPFAGR
jgi:hypothetical protein